MKGGIVVVLGRMREVAIEGVEARKVQLPAKELLTDPAKKSLHFSLRRSISYRGMGQEAADAGADLDDFLGGVNGSVIDVQTRRNTALVESGAQGFDEGMDILVREELAVAADARSIIGKSEEARL